MIKPGTRVTVERQGRMKEGTVVKLVDAMALVQFEKGTSLVPLGHITPLGDAHGEEQATG